MPAFDQFINPDLVQGYNIGQSLDKSGLLADNGQWQDKQYIATAVFL